MPLVSCQLGDYMLPIPPIKGTRNNHWLHLWKWVQWVPMIRTLQCFQKGFQTVRTCVRCPLKVDHLPPVKNHRETKGYIREPKTPSFFVQRKTTELKICNPKIAYRLNQKKTKTSKNNQGGYIGSTPPTQDSSNHQGWLYFLVCRDLYLPPLLAGGGVHPSSNSK